MSIATALQVARINREIEREHSAEEHRRMDELERRLELCERRLEKLDGHRGDSVGGGADDYLRSLPPQ